MPMKSITPLEITDLELEFMKKLNPEIRDISSRGKHFFYLKLSAESRYMKELECQENVSRKVKRDGGKALIGWIIWKSQVLIEANYHHVWQSPKGRIKDITPRKDREKNILFVLSPKQEDDGMIQDNIRQILLDIPIVHEFCEVSSEITKVMRENWVPYKSMMSFNLPVVAKLNELEGKKASLLQEINHYLDSSNSTK